MERSGNMTDQEYIQAMGWLAGQKLKAFAELNAYGKTDEPGTALAGFEEEYGKAARKQAIIDVIIQALEPQPEQKKSPGERIALDAATCLGYILRGTTALFLLLLSLRFWADVLHTGLPAVILAAVLLAVAAACIRHILHKDEPARKAH